jgi:hypothetical protein
MACAGFEDFERWPAVVTFAWRRDVYVKEGGNEVRIVAVNLDHFVNGDCGGTMGGVVCTGVTRRGVKATYSSREGCVIRYSGPGIGSRSR